MIDCYRELLNCFADILKLDGYRVLKAADVHQGVELFLMHRDEINLVIGEIDVLCGEGMVARRIRTICERKPVLFVSSLDEYDAIRKIGEYRNYYLLNKPVPPEVLGEYIDGIIDDAR